MEFVRQHKKLSIIVLCLLILFMGLSITFGKYIYNVIDSYILETKDFYFNSTVLGVNKKEHSINNWDGVNSYLLTIDLNNRKNSLKKTEIDIEYNIEVTCSDEITCSVSKTNDILYKDKETNSYQIIINPKKPIKAGNSVKIETKVTSITPYKKILSGSYIISVENSDYSYSIEDAPKNQFLKFSFLNSIPFYKVNEAFDSYKIGDLINLNDYNKLTEANKNKCYSSIVTINFDPNLIYLDMTNSSYLDKVPGSEKAKKINGHDYIYEFKFKVNATSSQNIIFYKSDRTKDYTYPEVNNNSIIKVTVDSAR